MITVDLRRSRRIGVVCAAVAALSVLDSQPASAEVANPGLVPADSAYIMSVPNGPEFWKAWEANALYDAFKKVMAMKDVEEKTAEFSKQLGIIESSLGFKLDGPTLSQVFASVDIYVTPKGENNISSVGIFSVADEAKLTKLIDLAEKAAEQAAANDDSSTETEDNDKATTSAFTEVDYNGIKVKTFNSGEDSENKLVYARPENKLLVAMDEADVRLVIDRLKSAAPAAGTVAGSEDFKKIDAALAAEKGEFYVYGNQELAMQLQSAGKDAPAGLTAAVKSLVDNLAPVTYYGASVKFAPKEISTYSYGLIKEGTSESLIMRNPGDQPLKIAGYVPEDSLMAAATSLFDAKSMYDLGVQVGDSIAAEAKDTEDDDDSDSDNEETTNTESVEVKLKKTEETLGFSVKDDLVPALGNEVGLAINEVNFPLVDATIMFGVNDDAKMKKVVDSLEKMVSKAVAAKGDDSTSAPEFAKEDVAGQTVNSMEIPGLFGYAPGFVLTEDFLILGTTKSALVNAVEANTSGKNLASSEAFKSLGHNITANANVLQFANMGKIVEIATQLTKAMAPAASKYLEALQVLDVSGSASRVENGAAVSRGILKLK